MFTVYNQQAAWYCCRCSLKEHTNIFPSREEMIEHLERHLDAGQKVPPSVFETLRAEIEATYIHTDEEE